MENINLKEFKSLSQKSCLGCIGKEKKQKPSAKLPQLYFSLNRFSTAIYMKLIRILPFQQLMNLSIRNDSNGKCV